MKWFLPMSDRVVLGLLAAQFFFGLGILLLQPSFEGVDETAHFSRIQEEAFGHPSPTGTPKISTDVYGYFRQGPMPYMWISFSGIHENDPIAGGFITYHDFFRQPPARITDYLRNYRQAPLAPTFEKGPQDNYEYQHPSFYYKVLAPAMKLAGGHLPLVGTVLLMRLLSWLLAFAGFCAGAWGSWVHLKAKPYPDAGPIFIFGLLYPFFMPAYFWEFARIGNDSLCLFFFGFAWAALLALMRKPTGEAWLYLALCLGLACLTKSFMLIVSGGILAFLFVFYMLKGNRSRAGTLVFVKLALLWAFIALPLYAGSYVMNANLAAMDFATQLKGGGRSFFDIPSAKNELIYGLRDTFCSAIWFAIGWSKVMLNAVFHIGFGLIGAGILVAYCVSLARSRRFILLLPLFVLGPFVAGLILHLLIMILTRTNNLTPAYYAHVAAPVLALMYGSGLACLNANRWGAVVTKLMVGMVVAANVYIVLAAMVIFSGVVQPQSVGVDYMLYFPAVGQGLAQFGTVIDHLSVLACPRLALASFGASIVLLIAAWCASRVSAKPASL